MSFIFYIKVVLYHVMIMDLNDISFAWLKVAWSDLSSIIAFSMSTCSTEVGQSGIVHRLKWFCCPTCPLGRKLTVHVTLATYWYLVTSHLYMDNIYLLYGIINTGIYTERNNALHGRKVWPHAHVRLIKVIFSWSCSGRLISSLPNRMALYHVILACNPAKEPSLISNTRTKNLVFRNHLFISEFL